MAFHYYTALIFEAGDGKWAWEAKGEDVGDLDREIDHGKAASLDDAIFEITCAVEEEHGEDECRIRLNLKLFDIEADEYVTIDEGGVRV